MSRYFLTCYSSQLNFTNITLRDLKRVLALLSNSAIFYKETIMHNPIAVL